MRKTLLTTIAAISLGATGLGTSAHAAEQNNNCGPNGQPQASQHGQQMSQQHSQSEHKFNQPKQVKFNNDNNKQYNTQQVSTTQNQQNDKTNADKTSTTKSSQSTSNTTSSSSDSSTTSSDSTSSVYQQFLAAGGTKALWESIVLPESGGDPDAVNSSGYKGLGQTKESWGTGSVATQTKGMINYAKERYGSIEAAIEFREANGWW
ncbi:hypothetical protein [Staphylococcus sp. ACRSN]|uniref:aggregation-promoting factor C-terminal-like domain-containing protein n=1 Tax=Staphylococcus sp. ACRSN TaxID=2918214 RepID=UPI0031BABB25